MGVVLITGELINCTCNYKHNEEINPDKNIIVTSDSGWKFDTSKAYSVCIDSFGYEYFEKSEDGTTLYLDTSSFVGWSAPDEVDLEEVYDANVPNVVDPPKVSVTGTFSNCSCNYKDGEEYSKDKRIEIVADAGYKFNETYTISVLGLPVILKSNEENTLLFYDESEGVEGIDVSEVYNAIKSVVQVTPFIQVFTPTNDELIALTKYRFNTKDSDLFTNITNLYITPYPIPEEIIQGTSIIKLGDTNTNVTSTILNNYEFIVELGRITVPEIYQNLLDYKDTTCILHVPFYEPIELQVSDVMNRTVEMNVKYNLYTGVGVLRVSNETQTFHVEKESIYTSYPYILDQNVVQNMNTILDNEVTTPYIEINRNMPLYKSDRETCYIVSSPSIMKGYYRVTELHMKEFDGYSSEYEEIERLMKEGVYNE